MGMYNILDADLSAYTVLLADDIELNLVMLKSMLSKYNFKVVTALNGQGVLDNIREYKPVLVIMDLLMPVLDGYDVIGRIREKPECSDVRIVVMSALNTNDYIERALGLGANDFIAKPVSMGRLYDVVSKQFEAVLAKRGGLMPQSDR